jgi:hypothetical protein
MFDRKPWLVSASILALVAGFAPLGAGMVTPTEALAQSGESGEAGEGAESGESSEAGESSESGESGEAGDDAQDGATLLSMAQGHLLVSLELYRSGERSLTKDHARHPEHELFPALDHALSELGESGLIERIEDYEHAVLDERPLADVEAAYAAFDAETDRLRSMAAPDAKAMLASVARLLRRAGAEYAEGVQEGKVVNRHEYADARGFVLAARDMVGQLSATNPDTIASVQAELASLDSLWPSLDAEAVDGDAAVLHGAAARIELAAGKI